MKSVMVRLTSFAMILLFLPMQACSPSRTAFEQAVADVKEERFDLALPALERESEVGNRDAQVLLAKLYAAGIGMDRNRAKANALLLCRQSPSCVAGKAEYYLAMDFLDGAGIGPSREDAKYWLIVSSKRGYAPANETLGELATSSGPASGP